MKYIIYFPIYTLDPYFKLSKKHLQRHALENYYKTLLKCIAEYSECDSKFIEHMRFYKISFSININYIYENLEWELIDDKTIKKALMLL